MRKSSKKTKAQFCFFLSFILLLIHQNQDIYNSSACCYLIEEKRSLPEKLKVECFNMDL